MWCRVLEAMYGCGKSMRKEVLTTLQLKRDKGDSQCEIKAPTNTLV